MVSKEELNLPCRVVYISSTKDFQVVDSKDFAIAICGNSDEAEFIREAVNTYHEREELIRELVEYVEQLGSLFDSDYDDFDDITIDMSLIQKAKKLLEESND